MTYTPFVRLVQRIADTRRGRDIFARESAQQRGPYWAAAFYCPSCGDEFAFDARCPRCDVPVAPIEREAA